MARGPPGRWLPADTLAMLLKVKHSAINDSLSAAYESGGIEAALAEYQAIKDGNS